MTYLLDTNVISELRKRAGVVDPNVVAWAQRRQVDDLFISVVTILEIEIGVARVERRDALRGTVLRRWFEVGVLAGFSGRILPIGLDVVRRTGPLQVPDPHAERDAYIAATAAVHGMAVVTRNVTDFEKTGVTLVNPWRP